MDNNRLLDTCAKFSAKVYAIRALTKTIRSNRCEWYVPFERDTGYHVPSCMDSLIEDPAFQICDHCAVAIPARAERKTLRKQKNALALRIAGIARQGGKG